MPYRITKAAALVLGGILMSLTPATAQRADVTVFAAASLKTALDEVAAAWSRETGKTATLSYAASSALARQIEQGAPAEIFISADREWMDYLGERRLIDPATRMDLLGNRIVLVAPSDRPSALRIAPGFDLAGALGDGRLAMANVDAVPAGRYGKAALETLGVWTQVQPRVAQAENVRAALALVARGEVPLGIIYATDAAAEPKVAIVDRFPETSHPLIIYPVALTAATRSADAAAFLAKLRSPEAATAYRRQGFTVLMAPAMN